MSFDLCLSFPQWQGSARNSHLPLGAQALRTMVAAQQPVVDVPLSDLQGDGFGILRWAALLAQFEAAQQLIAARQPKRLFTLGGDCAVDLAPISYLNSLYPGLTVIWVDAHADCNSASTSPSGCLHGMPVRMLFGDAPAPLLAALSAPLRPDQFHYLALRCPPDPGEAAFTKDHGLRNLTNIDGLRGPVHVHFDLDALEPAEFPHVGYPEPGGISVDYATGFLKQIAAQCDMVGFTLTEFSPLDESAARDGLPTLEKLYAAAIQ
jgi:arginase